MLNFREERAAEYYRFKYQKFKSTSFTLLNLSTYFLYNVLKKLNRNNCYETYRIVNSRYTCAR